MSSFTLDRHAALVVIDLQKGIVAMPTAHPSQEIVARAAALARAFRSRALSVALVNVAGQAPGRTERQLDADLPPDWTELVPELGAEPGDHLVTKLQWGAFTGTSLDHILRRQGVTQVILAGISTSIGVESTARAAHELGYNVGLVTDAMTDLQDEAHRHSVEAVFPRLGERTTTAELLALLRA